MSPVIANRARRGDVVVIHTPASYDMIGKGRTVTEGYRVGIVISITRDGLAKVIDTGRGLSGYIDPRGHGCNIRGCTSRLQAGATVDTNSLRTWLGSGENAQPQPTLDAARDVVRRFLKS